jgi:methanogen homocitrate synthase
LEVFPFSTKFLGYDNVKIVLGKGSGKASIIYKLKELGFDVPPKRELDKIIEKVKEAAEEKKRVLTESEFRSIIKEVC